MMVTKGIDQLLRGRGFHQTFTKVSNSDDGEDVDHQFSVFTSGIWKKKMQSNEVDSKLEKRWKIQDGEVQIGRLYSFFD